MSKTSISSNEELRKGEYLLSTNGNYKAMFQHDGNFVVYTWCPVWSTDTENSHAYRVLLQEDNNLVMYTREDRPVWASNTNSNQHSDRMRLTMSDNGRLVLDKNGMEVWCAPFRPFGPFGPFSPFGPVGPVIPGSKPKPSGKTT